jgi:AraC family transcriptional regulator
LTPPNNSSPAAPRNYPGIALPLGTPAFGRDLPLPAFGHELIRGTDIGLVYADLEPLDTEMHSHREHAQITLLFEPAACELTWRVKGSKVERKELKGAQLCIVAPNVEHRLFWKRRAGMATFYVRPSFLQGLGYSGGALRGVHIQDLPFIAGHDALARHLASVFEALCVDRAAHHDREFVIAVGRALTGRLLKFHMEGVRRGDRDGRLTRAQQRNINSFMDSNLHRRIRVEELMKLVGLSKAHLIRVFTRTYGAPPVRKHLVRRLERAQAMLLRTDCSILDAVERYGFGDQSYFNRAFLKYLNCRPGALLRLRAKLPPT